MAEPLDLLELLAAPQCNATLVEGGQVGAFGRPAHVRLRPALRQENKNIISPQVKQHRGLKFITTSTNAAGQSVTDYVPISPRTRWVP